MQKSFIKFKFLTKSFFLITVLVLLGCAGSGGGSGGGNSTPAPAPQPTAPDLVVSSFSANPTTISSRETVSLSATITNSGNLAADSIVLRYHRSPNNNISDSGNPIATDDISNLSAGSTSDATANVTGHSSGIYYYWACVVHIANESNKNNNCSTTAIKITGPLPDISVSSFSASPTIIRSGETVTLSATITNSGKATADSITLRFFSSPSDNTNDSDDNLVTTDTISSISVDSNANSSVNVTGHSSGTMYYGVCVYVAGETSTDNNCSVPQAITIGVPDLVISSFSASPTIISFGGTINLSAIVTNSGNGTADTTTLRFLRSTDSTISTSDTFLNITRNISNLSADSSENSSASVTGHISGIMYYGACVGAVADETSITNNCSDSVAITALQPDLAVGFTVSKNPIGSGETFNLSATVTNSGSGTANSTTLQFFRSPNNIINNSANNLATTDIISISRILANSSSDATVDVTGHSRGIYYYWACVAAVSGDSDNTNNCSDSVAVTAIVGAAWTEVTANAGWSARQGHRSVVFKNKMWVIGGSDVWFSVDGTSWTRATSDAGWAARRNHSSIVFENKIWVLGGYDIINVIQTDIFFNDVWSSDNGISWTQAKPNNNAGWSRREHHSSVVFDNKIWVLGGWNRINIFGDVWSSSNGINWTQVTAPTGWSNHVGHTSIVFDNKIWVLGGNDGRNNYKNDVLFSDDGIAWKQATASANWSTRHYHASTVFDNKMWVLGGEIGILRNRTRYNDVWFSENGTNWTQATASASWSARYAYTSVAFDNNIWVLGGWEDGNNRLNDIWSSGINNNSFASATALNVVPNSANKPQSLSSHSAILPAGASDYYKFSLTAKNLNWTFATDSTTDTVCELYNNSQTEQASDDNSGTGNNCSITRKIDTTGDYYIKISGGGNNSNSVTGNYTLNIDSTIDTD